MFFSACRVCIESLIPSSRLVYMSFVVFYGCIGQPEVKWEIGYLLLVSFVFYEAVQIKYWIYAFNVFFLLIEIHALF